ncbi:MAG TPA: hypothetical protein IGR64_10895 [Leptolyngbyaceae cyanobacterium M65_K2018_010]|nr:hypothetical protein [Leptolyngbyaceae cyanobacterium M65_K2018_010]
MTKKTKAVALEPPQTKTAKELHQPNTRTIPRWAYLVVRTNPRTQKEAVVGMFFSYSYACIFIRGLKVVNPDAELIFRIQEEQLHYEPTL